MNELKGCTEKPDLNSIKSLCLAFAIDHNKSRYNASQKLKKNLGILEQDVYLGYDDTLFKNGKNGFAITEKGVYCRHLLDSDVGYLSFKELFNSTKIHIDGPTIYAGGTPIACISGFEDDRNDLKDLFDVIRNTMEQDQSHEPAKVDVDDIDDIDKSSKDTSSLADTKQESELNNSSSNKETVNLSSQDLYYIDSIARISSISDSDARKHYIENGFNYEETLNAIKDLIGMGIPITLDSPENSITTSEYESEPDNFSSDEDALNCYAYNDFDCNKTLDEIQSSVKSEYIIKANETIYDNIDNSHILHENKEEDLEKSYTTINQQNSTEYHKKQTHGFKAGTLGSLDMHKFMDLFIEDDKKIYMDIFSVEVDKVISDYMLTKREVRLLLRDLQISLETILSSTYLYDNEESYFYDSIEEIAKRIIIDSRSRIKLHSNEDTLGKNSSFVDSENDDSKPINELGNSFWNLRSGGEIASQGNWAFYSDLESNGSLYKTDLLDSTKEIKLDDDIPRSINVVGDWIYYIGSSDYIYKMKVDGTSKSKLYSEKVDMIFVCNNQVYLIKKGKHSGDFLKSYDAEYVYSIDCNGNNLEELFHCSQIVHIDSEKIYYFDEHRYLGDFILQTKVKYEYESPVTNCIAPFIYNDGKVYFEHVDILKEELIYWICNIDIDSEEYTHVTNKGTEKIWPQKIDVGNVNDGWVYFAEDNFLNKFHLDDPNNIISFFSSGSKEDTVIEKNILIIGNDLFYTYHREGVRSRSVVSI